MIGPDHLLEKDWQSFKLPSPKPLAIPIDYRPHFSPTKALTMTLQIDLYYKGSLLSEVDYSNIAEENNIPYDVVSEVVAQIHSKGEILFSQYTGTLRERVRELSGHISKEPPSDELEDTSPAQRTESDEIVDHASTSLMQAMTNNDGHFLITPEGICTINPTNPPSLVHSYQTVQNVISLRQLGDKIDDKSSWMLGSIIASLEELHGEAFNVSQVVEQTEKAYNTIQTALMVFKAFKDKRYDLPYTSHKEIYFSKIDKEDPDRNFECQKLVLHKAELYEFTSKHIRALASIAKKMDGDMTVIKNIKSHQQGMDLIDSYKQAKTTYFLYDEGVWVWLNGLEGERPAGAVVIDVKNKKAWANGEEVDIKQFEKPSDKESK